MTFHHVGCLVNDIPAALKLYQHTGLAAGASVPMRVPGQKVQVCFLPAGNDAFIEFVQPDPDNAFLQRMLRKGISYYHVAYLCSDVETCAGDFVRSGAHELNRFHSEAFGGRLCVFLTTPEQLIELIQAA